ncbi:MAG: hypothetical protein PUP93_16515 [Rhizonema sp. NSF051]|nr:hypothetical protein [Rhizonema sp. NSF051]
MPHLISQINLHEFPLQQGEAPQALFDTEESSPQIDGHQKGFGILIEDDCS